MLNPEQRHAADHKNGPMLVLAGPGSGKTATLAERYNTLHQSGVNPAQILCVTFTRAAADQLKERISSLANIPQKNIFAGTFHGIAKSFMNRYSDQFPEARGKKIADENTTLRILSSLCSSRDFNEEDAVTLISRLKDDLKSPDWQKSQIEKANIANREHEKKLYQIYNIYQSKMNEEGLMDFGDIIYYAVTGLKRTPELAWVISERFKYILVDEYQDINKAQYEFLKCLTAAHQNIWVVGDDDQALYGFRGSDVKYIQNFDDFFQNTETVVLKHNYRSQQNIVEFAKNLIGQNKQRHKKNIIAHNGPSSKIKIYTARNGEAEAAWITWNIKKKLSSGTDIKEIAVLSRSSWSLGYIERALKRENIPCKLVGAPSFWSNTEIRTALALLRDCGGHSIDPKIKSAPRWQVDKIESRRRTKEFLPLAKQICHDLSEMIPRSYGPERKQAWKFNLEQLLEEITETPDASAINAKIKKDWSFRNVDNNSIKLSTIHSSKGLEWDNVFVLGWEDKIMPTERSDDIEEERRLAYVAVTRARHNLYLSRAEERAKRSTRISPFLEEAIRFTDKNILDLTKHIEVVKLSDDIEVPDKYKFKAKPYKKNPSSKNPDWHKNKKYKRYKQH